MIVPSRCLMATSSLRPSEPFVRMVYAELTACEDQLLRSCGLVFAFLDHNLSDPLVPAYAAQCKFDAPNWRTLFSTRKEGTGQCTCDKKSTLLPVPITASSSEQQCTLTCAAEKTATGPCTSPLLSCAQAYYIVVLAICTTTGTSVNASIYKKLERQERVHMLLRVLDKVNVHREFYRSQTVL